MRKRNSLKSSKTTVLEDLNVIKGIATFTFENGDLYDGEYKLHTKLLVLVKQGHGVYLTSDHDKYDTKWENDKYTDGELHVCYNDGAAYEGKVNVEGEMWGPGTYKFPDGSSIEAIWLRNRPFSNVVFKEPLGYAWTVESLSRNERDEQTILFVPENHFWNELHEPPEDEDTT